MCLCTQYDSQTCGHSWMSLTQPCGFCRDLLNCPNRQTVQTLIAPPMSCPQCNGAFWDAETMQMIQGPWGCNQLVRSHYGGNEIIPGHWGVLPQPWGSSLMVPGDYWASDYRLTGPCGNQRVVCDDYFVGGWTDPCHGFGGPSRQHTSSRRYHRRTVKSGPGCVVM